MAGDQYIHSSHSSLYESSIVNVEESTRSTSQDNPTTEGAALQNGVAKKEGSSTLEISNFPDEALDVPLPESSEDENQWSDSDGEAKLEEAPVVPLKTADISWTDDFPPSVPLPEPSNTPYNNTSSVSLAVTPSNALIQVNGSPSDPAAPSSEPPQPSLELSGKDLPKKPRGSKGAYASFPPPPPPPPLPWPAKEKKSLINLSLHPPPPPPPPGKKKWPSGTVADWPFFGKRKKAEAAPVPPLRAPPTYLDTIKSLSSHLPHLVNTLKRTSRNGATVTCFDYVDSKLVSQPSFTYKSDDKRVLGRTSDKLVLHLKDNIPPNLTLRLIMVEDLSVEMIELLGSTFNISPEVFEEHLLNSGWQNGRYEDPESDTWNTRCLKKDYASIRWYRPVIPALRRFTSAKDREVLLDLDSATLRWTEPVLVPRSKQTAVKRGVRHEASLSTNILRRSWDLKTKVSENDDLVSLKSPVAWEERATIWNKQMDGCLFVILLLDPLPILRDQLSGATSALEALGFSHEEEKSTRSSDTKQGKKKEHQTMEDGFKEDKTKTNKIDTNAKTNLADRDSISETFQPPSLIVRRTYAKARRQAQSRFARFTSPFLGPLFFGFRDSTIRDEKNTTGLSENIEEAIPPEKRDSLNQENPRDDQRRNIREERRKLLNTILPPWMARLMGNPPEKDQVEAVEPEVDEEEEGTELITLTPTDTPFFTSVVPREPMISYDLFSSLDDIQRIAQHLGSTNSTATDLMHWLQHKEHQQIAEWTRLDPLHLLFGIIHRDTMEIVRLMNRALTEISHDILDDSIIQQRLLHWRQLLECFELELRQLQDSLHTFATFLLPSQITKSAAPIKSMEVNPVTEQLDITLKQISDLRQRTTRSYKSLMANMSIVESKRGIAEAESVTKLTELAFLFIPLTFSASIFSMQVRELNAANISIWAFFILAIVITTSSYCLRLFIRSASVIRFRKRMVEQVRADAELPPGAPIPTRSFFIWMWHRFAVPTSLILLTFAGAGIAVLIAPLAIFWTRHTNGGYKAIISVLVLASGLTTAFYVIRAMFRRDSRGIVHLRQDIFRPVRGYWNHGESSYSSFHLSSRAFSWIFATGTKIVFIITALAAAPLAAIWTRPLERGIKVSATLSIVVIYLVIVLFLALNFIPNGIRNFRGRRRLSFSSLSS